MHVVFEDGTVADVFSAEVVLGGISSWLEVRANNHRTRCSLNPIDALTTFNPREELLARCLRRGEDRLEARAGAIRRPDEDWMNGYPQQFQDFVEAAHEDREPLCGACSPGTPSRSCTRVRLGRAKGRGGQGSAARRAPLDGVTAMPYGRVA